MGRGEDPSYRGIMPRQTDAKKNSPKATSILQGQHKGPKKAERGQEAASYWKDADQLATSPRTFKSSERLLGATSGKGISPQKRDTKSLKQDSQEAKYFWPMSAFRFSP